MMRSLRLVCAVLVAAGPAIGSAAPPVQLKLRYDEGVAQHEGKPLRARDVKISASSRLCEKRGTCHGPERLLDGKTATAWCEGAPGNGVGERLVIDLQRARRLTSIAFVPFYAKSKRALFDNAQAKQLELDTDAGRFLVAFAAEDPEQAFISGGQLDHSLPYVEFASDPRVRRAITTRRVEILVKAVHPGARFKDLCLSEIAIYAQ